MSVIAYEYSEFEGVYNEMVKVPELQKIVMNNDYVKRYNSRQMPVSMKYKYEDALGRLFWYMYVANRVAYSLQYQRNEDIFTPEVTAEKYTLDEAKQKFGSFMYNIYTNNGTVFLSEDWLGLAEDIKKFIYPKDFEAGGTLPTPFGQAGLVGETGAMNEMDLFAMGGDLPQGVHQYYANTYNPAYPTPHGYAKGGALSKEELKLNLYKPSGDYFMEKKDGKIILHLTSKDASNLPLSFFEKFNVEKNGKGYYGTSYIVSKKMAKGGKTQGYNDKLDESLGNTKGKRSKKEQNYKDRRNESEAMKKKEGKRKYARVKTMDKNRRKRKTPMTLAKEIRKEGEKWVDAVKRASKMMKNK